MAALLDRMDLPGLAAQVLIPIYDLRAGRDRVAEQALAERRARAGFGGFLLFGGELEDLPARLVALRAAAPHGAEATPLVCADLERGLGQQVRGGSRTPPAMSLGAAGSTDLARRVGEGLGREARAAGIDWVFGPVLDLADEPLNPIVGARAFGKDPAEVARIGAAFIAGLQAGGVLACAKHFPGHGATTDDSHAALPRVTRPRSELEAKDLVPFRAAVAAGVASIMTAHVAYPPLGEEGPATLSPKLVTGLLRRELRFEGLVVTDALIMDGVRGQGGEETAATLALEAGCDALLYPNDPEACAAAIVRWAERDAANARRLREAAGRVLAAKARIPRDPRPPGPAELALPLELARAALVAIGPALVPLRAKEPLALLLLDDDEATGFGVELGASLDEAGHALTVDVLNPKSPDAIVDATRARLASAPRIVAAVGCRVRAWKGRAGLHERLAAFLRDLPAASTTVVGLCGPAPLLPALPANVPTLLAWGDEPAAQRAAVEALLGRVRAAGRLP